MTQSNDIKLAQRSAVLACVGHATATYCQMPPLDLRDGARQREPTANQRQQPAQSQTFNRAGVPTIPASGPQNAEAHPKIP